jgi:hypothetical protein
LDLAVERIEARKEVGSGRGNPTKWYPSKVTPKGAESAAGH